MTPDRIGRPIHPKDAAGPGDDIASASPVEVADLSAAYAGWVDFFRNGAAIKASAAPARAATVAPACVLNGFGLSFANAVPDTAGAAAMMAPQAISLYGFDGTGIRIGILSDSFNRHGGESSDIANGLLPADGVTVLEEGPSGNDEGRAMAQLIHDVAPGAEIYFYSAFWSEQDFANGILALAQAGCTVIVDDVTYFDEPFFQDGSVLQAAVEAVTAEGVNYFTSASNEGSTFYEATFTPVAANLPGGVGHVAHAQKFSNNTALQSVTINSGVTAYFDLQWDQPFASIGSGHSSANSLSLYLFTSTGTFVTSAVDDEVGGDPVQILGFHNTLATTGFELAIVWNDGAVQPGLLKYIVYSGGSGVTINDANAGVGSGTVIGHEMIPAANAVGAVNASSVVINNGTVTFAAREPDPSVGPGEILFDANGNRLAQPIVPDKVEFTAPDGIGTSVFNPFFGTSAAAPNAAAVAALMLQANPNLTPAQVTEDLTNTAFVMNGGSNNADGAGFIQAPGAVAAALGIACYCRGTRIATPTGEKPIEALRIGEPVLTARNTVRPIRWIGRRRYGAAQIAQHQNLQPVLIRAGALGNNVHGPVPARDLRVSPEHALALPDADGALVLVPANLLINGHSILRDTAAADIEYLHLELRDHDVVLAEGVAAESFVDDNSRALFDNAAEFKARYPNEPVRSPNFCAPRVTGGRVLAHLRTRLERVGEMQYGALRGFLDRADREVVGGWVHDAENPGCAVSLEIVLNGEVIDAFVADRFRADLERVAGGYCSFYWKWPRALDPARRHIVSVRRAGDGMEMPGSPLLLDRNETMETALADLKFAEPEMRREMAEFLLRRVEVLEDTLYGV